MNKEKHLKDIEDIKEIMNRSSRFMSLSGLSGILAGLVGLAAGYILGQRIIPSELLTADRNILMLNTKTSLLIVATISVLMAIGLAILLSYRKSLMNSEQFWTEQAGRVLLNLMIPLVAGGVTCLIFLKEGYIGFLPGLTLIFYGLGLVNASKYTLSEIRSLGVLQGVLGLLALQFIPHSVVIWAIGFGGLHIIYGVWMHFKYER